LTKIFAYLSVERPPKLVDPGIRIQVQTEKKSVRLREDYFGNLFKKKRK